MITPKNEFSSIINKVHLAPTPSFLKNIPDNSIGLVLTSPSYYDSVLYILEEDVLEFGWRTYEDYLKHLEANLDELLRVTVPGGKLVLVLSNTPETDEDGYLKDYWPINHDTSAIARKIGWKLMDEVIWVKTNRFNYEYLKSRKSPEASVKPKHDIVTVYRKPGPYRQGIQQFSYSSIWEMGIAGPIKEYNRMYPSFPDELVKRCLQLWSLPKDIILDPYAGSGQVCRIAKGMKRPFIGVEIDQAWGHLWEDING